MAHFVSVPPVCGRPAEVHTVAQNALMTYATDDSGRLGVYLQGVGSVVAGDAVTYDEAGVTTLLAANAIGPVAIATAAVDATTEYGWFVVSAPKGVTVNGVASSADNVGVGRETTNGKLGDGRGAGDQIQGAVARSATTGAADMTLQIIGVGGFVDDFQGA
jgi:hypothetical protein